MKQNSALKKILFVLFVALIVLACNALVAAPTPTLPAPTSVPEATNTKIPPTAIFTPTLRPTYTPNPTATDVPSTPTPAAKGESVTNGKIEVTVLDLYRHDKIVPGGTYYYWAKPGFIIIDLFVKVKNLQSGSVSINWGDVRVVEGDSDTVRKIFAGGWKAVNNREKVAPLSFGYKEVSGSDVFTFEDTVYLQVIFFITKNAEFVLFSIEDAPLIKVNK